MDTLRLSRDNPWPGLESYDEDSAEFFRGRGGEAEELLGLIRRAPVVVLYGLSGLGKTSLLQAGVYPALRQEDMLPVTIRLDYGPDSPSLEQQVRDSVLEALAKSGGDAPAPEPGESLWSWLHRKDVDFWSARNRLLTPLLVFDPFEEMFTLGRQGGRIGEERRAFLAALACLAENRPPAELRKQMEREPALAERYDFRARDYRLLFAFREDFLPDFEGLRSLMPSIAHHRLRLLPMDEAQALQAITQGGSGLVKPEVAKAIVHFVATAKLGVVQETDSVSKTESVLPEQENGSEATETDSSPNPLSIEPVLLSLVCAELNQRRRDTGQANITAKLLQDSQETIIADFYQRRFEGLDPAVREYVEDQLLTRAGHRDSRALEDASANPGVTEEALNILVNRRLLRIEERYGRKRVELIHDRLAPVAKQSRDRRVQEKAEAEARRQARLRRRRWLWIGLVSFAVLALMSGFAFYSYRQWQKAETAVELALQIVNRLTYDLPDRLKTVPGTLKILEQTFDENAQLLQRIDALRGETAKSQREKAVNLDNRGDSRMDLGDLEGAAKLHRAAHAILEKLAQQAPQESDRQRDLSVSHNKIGDVQAKQGDLAGALASYRADLAISEKLAAQDPANSQWQNDLSLSHEKIGDAQAGQGDLAGALASYRASLTIREKLAAQDPAHLGWQRDLSVSHDNIGDVQVKQGDLAGALASYRADLAISEKLAEQDPANASWQRDLSVSHEKVGDVLTKQGDLAGALASYRASLDIREKLAAQDPANAGWQADLAFSHAKLGMLLRKMDKSTKALSEFRSALGLLEPLVAKAPDYVQWRQALELVKQQIAELEAPSSKPKPKR